MTVTCQPHRSLSPSTSSSCGHAIAVHLRIGRARLRPSIQSFLGPSLRRALLSSYGILSMLRTGVLMSSATIKPYGSMSMVGCSRKHVCRSSSPIRLSLEGRGD
jgi:hypothetical protein